MTEAWSFGLIRSLKDNKNHILSSDIAVVINDKYPKAKHHYLVLPFEDIPSIFSLNKSHLPLLEELHLLALNIIEVKGQQHDNFKIGFHAQPSLERLHLHVISKDFVSDALKKQKHWNSFNTILFVPYADLYEQLETQGAIQPLSKTEVDTLAKLQMQCNQCEFVAKNIPVLKKHLFEHWQTKNS